MRLRLYAGLLGLGIGLGALLGIYHHEQAFTRHNDPLVDEYVKLVSVLYARGESLAAVEARLDRLGFPNTGTLVRYAATHGPSSAGNSSGTDQASAGDVASMLTALAPDSGLDSLAPSRILASGRGTGSPTAVRADSVGPVAVATPEFPAAGRIAPSRGDASLRIKPSLDAPVLRIIPRGVEVTLLGTERGQAIEGAEDRWYHVRHGEAMGYIYFNLVEQLQ